MGNFLKDLASRYNLEANQSQVWGSIEGYWFQIALPAYGGNSLMVRTAVHFPDDAAVTATADGLVDMVQKSSDTSYERKGGTIRVSIRRRFGGYKAQEIEAILLRLVALFRKAGATAGCFSCNEDRTDSFAMVNGIAMKLCSKCQADISQTINKQAEEYASTKNNYLRGLFGALIGALLGSLLWVLIGYIGYIAAIGGIAISFCAIKGYQIMKGKVTIPSIIYICIICLAAMVLAQFVLFDIQIIKSVTDQGYDVDYGKVILNTFQLPFEYPDGSFFTNLGLGVLFLGLGSWRLIGSLGIKAKTPAGKFQRL